jgi:hypothetical protein
MEQNISWLEIAMKDLLPIKQIESRPQLSEYFDSLFLGKPFFRLNVVSKCAPVAVLINQINIVAGSEHFDESDDVGVIYFGKYANLVVRELTELGSLLEFVQVHHLNRIKLLSEFVLRPVHVTVLPPAHTFHQHIVFNLFIHIHSPIIMAVLAF